MGAKIKSKEKMMKTTWGEVQTVEGEKESGEVSKEVLVHEPSILEESWNRIYFYADIDRGEILKLQKTLRDKSNALLELKRGYSMNQSIPIYLHINSYGGGIFSGLAGMDEILRCESPIYTIVDGCCASAATFLSVAGAHRMINKHAFTLIHQLSSFMWGKYAEFQDELQNLDRLMETIKGIYKEFTQVPSEKLDAILRHDLWFDAETSLKYGIVDEVI